MELGFDLFFDCCGVHGASFWSFLAKEYMALGVQLRSQRRLRTVLQTASHVASGELSDFLAAVSGDGVSFDTMPRGGPGASTLARARFKMDFFLMLARQHQWKIWCSESQSQSSQPQPRLSQSPMGRIISIGDMFWYSAGCVVVCMDSMDSMTHAF